MFKINKEQFSWVLYDWANSSFATVIMASILPVFYKKVSAYNLPQNMSTSYWAYTHFISALLIALLSPLFGLFADKSLKRKLFLQLFLFLSVFSTFYFVLQILGIILKFPCFIF